MPESGTGNLTVMKTVTGNAGDPHQDFEFMIMLSDTDINGTYGDIAFSNGVAYFTLRHGKSKTVSGLPAGIRYSVIERSANQDGYATTMLNQTGSIVEDDTVLTIFVNAKDELNIPQTGDPSHLFMWIALAFASLVVMSMLFRRRDDK